ncbi:MAG TPA: HAD family hydrolase [Hydrogenophaga sp.]|uniref:HAD family hydrolase n=1 Tax=Hydrogenophaga sp. TaxID=1904254 RepID=UPI002C905C6E|nr:HAD family hydrolase [Hydrogenophaga sp.]HMN92984.1 HAD family hydrolase [Hydrogenophaga sp.]HMP09130.1 HAD family hydrolase [Hydrogenophaga sp.]
MNSPFSNDPDPVFPVFDPARVQAISLDLDDTLWPIWPTIARAEAAMQAWLELHAPATASLCAEPGVARAARERMGRERPDFAHDLSALRRETVRTLLSQAGDDPALAEAAFEVFFDERQRVELFEDALPALDWLSARFPIVALSNGNADLRRVGLARHFHAAISAREFGVGKPDPRIFHAAAEAAGVPARAVLHIGDDVHLDAVGALEAGMQAAWVNREARPWSHERWRPQVILSDLRTLVAVLDGTGR